MSKEIYYFSGSGNSFAVARDLAQKTGCKLIPIASVIMQEHISTDATVLGIVFPIHNVIATGLPLIVRRFVSKLEKLDSKYIFAVCTCGGGSGAALANLQQCIHAQGGKLTAGYTIKMPYNCPPFTKPAKQPLLIARCKEQLEGISETVNVQGKSPIKRVSPLLKLMTYPLQLLLKPAIFGNLKRVAHTSEQELDKIVSLLDSDFSVNESCNGCGICVWICPVDNLELEEDRPRWLHHCECCLACFEWCPQQAIQGGLSSRQRYHHPDVQLSEMLLRD